MSVRAKWADWEVAGYILLLQINNVVRYLIGAQTEVLASTNTSIFGGIGSIFQYWYCYWNNSTESINVCTSICGIIIQTAFMHKLCNDEIVEQVKKLHFDQAAPVIIRLHLVEE